MNAKIIFINGGSASGKTTLANLIKESLGKDAILLSQDMFYRDDYDINSNFDRPDAFDWALQRQVMKDLSENKTVQIPIYNFEKFSREGYRKLIPSKIIIFEGIFCFHDEILNQYSNFKIFVDTPSDIRLSRRILRDVNEKKRKLEVIIDRWNDEVQPSYLKFIVNNRHLADIIIPWRRIKHKSIKSVVATINNL